MRDDHRRNGIAELGCVFEAFRAACYLLLFAGGIYFLTLALPVGWRIISAFLP